MLVMMLTAPASVRMPTLNCCPSTGLASKAPFRLHENILTMDTNGFLEQALIYLAAGIVAVPIFKRLGLGAVLGYLVAGIAIGPWGLRLIAEPETVLDFGEIGVVLLLFLVG